MKHFLRRDKTRIAAKGGKPVILQGVNLGGWLMMEAYILYAPNFPEQRFKREFAAALGQKALRLFEKKYRENFIRERDIQNIARLGFNCMRVPFNGRLVEKAPYRYDRNGVRFLDRVIRWAGKCGIWVILDLHAAPGSQNHDWHGDSAGKAELWTKENCQDRTLALWEFLADRYKNEEYVAGYDLLNEAVLDDTELLNRFYGYRLNEASTKEGLAKTRWPGRMEIIRRNPIVVLDGGHNVDAAKALVVSIRKLFPTRDLRIIFGASKDKAVKAVMKELGKLKAPIYLASSHHPRAASVSNLEASAKTYFKEIHLSGNLRKALEDAKKSLNKKGVILVTGSLFLVGEARKILCRN